MDIVHVTCHGLNGNISRQFYFESRCHPNFVLIVHYPLEHCTWIEFQYGIKLDFDISDSYVKKRV